MNSGLPAHLFALHLGCSAAPGIVELPANSIAVPLPWSQHTVKNRKESFFWSLAGCYHYSSKLSHGRRILSFPLNEQNHSLK